MPQSRAKRLVIGATVLGAVVAGAAVIVKRRRKKALFKKGIGNAKTKSWQAGLHRGASRANVSVKRRKVDA